MSIQIVVFLVVVVLMVIVRVWLSTARTSQPTPKPTPKPIPNPMPKPTPSPQPSRGDDLQELIRSGQKIQAIKLYREQTGLGLKEAKDAVEAMMAGTFTGPRQAPIPQQFTTPTLENLIRDGRKIEAIKLYREQTGVGLKEAKDQVEALAEQLRGR